MNQLDYDSAMVLYRAARAADETYLQAQVEYIRYMQFSLQSTELRRELATTDSSSALKMCLMAGSNHAAQPTVAHVGLLAVEARFGPTQCTDALLTYTAGGPTTERLTRALRDNPQLSELWGTMANKRFSAGEFEAAEKVFDAAAAALDDPMERVQLALGRIDQRITRGDTAGGVALWKALAADVARDGRPGPAVYYLRARCANGRHLDPGTSDEQREEYCRQLLALLRPRHAWFEELVISRVRGKDHLERGEFPAAFPWLNRATVLADSLGIAGLQLDTYTLRGRTLYKSGKLELAQRDLKHAIALGPAAELPYYLTEAYHNLAHTYEAAGRFREAAEAADSMAATADRDPNVSSRWMSRHDAGTIRWEAGWHAAAARDFEAMRRIVDEQKADGHYFAGDFLERKGDLGRALEYYRTGSLIAVSPDPRNYEGLTRVYEALGFPDSAEQTARKHDARPDRWSLTDGPLLPDLMANRGRLREAVSIADDWARRVARGGNIEGAAIAYIRLAELLLKSRDPKAALIAANSADSLTRLLGLTAHAINARTLKGRALMDQGQRAAGLAALEDAVRLAVAHPSTEALRSTNQALGDALESMGRHADALVAYDHAGSAVERMTAGLDQDAYRTGFKALHLAPFDGALRVLLRGAVSTADAEAALAWSVRRKAAALALAGQPGVVARGISIAALRERLGDDEALIDYSVVDSTVAAIVVRRNAITRVPLAAPASQLADWVEALRRPLMTTPGGAIDLAHAPFDGGAAASLYRALIEPLAPALIGAKSLAIAPDGALWYVPFAALVTGRINGRPSYLIEQFEVRLLPSAQFLGARAGSALPHGFRVDAFTYSAPGGAAELEVVRSTLGAGRVVVHDGSAATERAALASRANVLHLAVHGAVDDRDPLASHLRLAAAGGDDGMLHLSEVAARRASPQLVVLTACEAVSGKLYAGEGLVGLARAFLVSGAHQVIASEWPVAASAAELSGVLYRELALGRSPAAALRSAQLALLATPATAHPIHWAGFVAFEGGLR